MVSAETCLQMLDFTKLDTKFNYVSAQSTIEINPKHIYIYYTHESDLFVDFVFDTWGINTDRMMHVLKKQHIFISSFEYFNGTCFLYVILCTNSKFNG